MRFAPARSCMIIPDMTIAELYTTIEAMMTCNQYSGSDKSDNIILYSGTWEHNKKIRR